MLNNGKINRVRGLIIWIEIIVVFVEELVFNIELIFSIYIE